MHKCERLNYLAKILIDAELLMDKVSLKKLIVKIPCKK